MLNFLRCLLIFALVTSFTWLLSAPPARADGCASLISLGAALQPEFRYPGDQRHCQCYLDSACRLEFNRNRRRGTR